MGNKSQLVKAEITTVRETSPGNYLLFVESPEIASQARPGQFLMVRCGEGSEKVLRRPLSIHYAQSPLLGLYFSTRGAGTRWLASSKPGDRLDIFGPLGNSFAVRPQTRRLLLLGGGMGISPLVFLAAESAERALEVTLVHGASTQEQLYGLFNLPQPPGSKVRTEAITEDGSSGRKGLITDYLAEYAPWADQICACGPAGMYSSMQRQHLIWTGKSVQVSLEARMGCGIGACFGCTINTRSGPKRVCREGPVFDLEDIIISELKV